MIVVARLGVLLIIARRTRLFIVDRVGMSKVNGRVGLSIIRFIRCTWMIMRVVSSVALRIVGRRTVEFTRRLGIGIVAELALMIVGRLGLLIVVQGRTQDFVDGTLEFVERLAVRVVGGLGAGNVNFVRLVGPGTRGFGFVGVHYLRSVIAGLALAVGRLGIGIVGRLTLGLVLLVGNLALAVLRVESYEVFRPRG